MLYMFSEPATTRRNCADAFPANTSDDGRMQRRIVSAKIQYGDDDDDDEWLLRREVRALWLIFTHWVQWPDSRIFEYSFYNIILNWEKQNKN